MTGPSPDETVVREKIEAILNGNASLANFDPGLGAVANRMLAEILDGYTRQIIILARYEMGRAS